MPDALAAALLSLAPPEAPPARDVEEVAERADRATLARFLLAPPACALALFGDETRAGQVYSRLNGYGPWAADAFRACNEGAHGSFTGDSHALVQDTRRLVSKLRQVLG